MQCERARASTAIADILSGGIGECVVHAWQRVGYDSVENRDRADAFADKVYERVLAFMK